MVDTGADSWVIAPTDAELLGIDYSRLKDPVDVLGVAGKHRCFPERAKMIIPLSDYPPLEYSIYIGILEQDPELDPLPSLLGRDVLNKWRMDYDPAHENLCFRPSGSDLSWS